MHRIEHIGIAVRDLDHSKFIFEKLLNTKSYKTEFVESEMVNTLFMKTGDQKIELLEASSPESAIASFIEKRGEGIHHIAFAVINIEEEMERLRAEGFTLLSEEPKMGADNKRICFVHPKETGGVLIELCEELVSHKS